MADTMSFCLDGEPFPWKRPAETVNRRSGFIQRSTDPDAAEHKKKMAQAAMLSWGHRPPFFGPIKMLVIATFAIPSSWPKALREAARRGEVYCDRDPDFDNIIKQVADALQFIAWVDDNQVGDGRSILRYGDHPRTECWISELEQGGLETPSQRRRTLRWARGEYDGAIAHAACGMGRLPRVLDGLRGPLL